MHARCLCSSSKRNAMLLLRSHNCPQDFPIPFPNFHVQITTLTPTTPNFKCEKPPSHKRLLVPRPPSTDTFAACNQQCLFFSYHLNCLLQTDNPNSQRQLNPLLQVLHPEDLRIRSQTGVSSPEARFRLRRFLQLPPR